MKISLENRAIQSLIKIYILLIIGFYPLALMHKDEYAIAPLTIKGVLFSAFLGFCCNFGLLFTLSKTGRRWKWITLCCLIFSAASSWLIFYLPAINPVSFMSDE